MSAHTPGPWHVSKSHRFVRHTLADQTAANVCDLSNGSAIHEDELQANARLIAAAPELLEACKAALLELDTIAEYDTQATQTTLEILRGVIAKATGTDL